MQLPNNKFTSWLYRPYLDLEPAPEAAPPLTHNIEVDYNGLVNRQEYSRIESTIVMSSFREALIRQSGLHKYPAIDPLRMPEELQTDRWKVFSAYLTSFKELNVEDQVNTARLLQRLAMYKHLTKIIEIPDDKILKRDGKAAELAFINALAKYVLNKEGRFEYDIREMEKVATLAPAGTMAKVSATYQMISQHVKFKYDLKGVIKWSNLHLEAINNLKNDLSDFDLKVLMSRYYRVLSFIPQMQGDQSGTIKIMDQCEEITRGIQNKNHAFDKSLCSKLLLYALLESRIKEALWLNDYSDAENRAKELVNNGHVHPRTFMTLGQVLIEQGKLDEAKDSYRKAIRYSPQGIEISAFMLGQCYELSGEKEIALEYYMLSVNHEPMAISSLKGVLRISETMSKKHISKWAKQQMLHLKETNQTEITNKVQPYQHEQLNHKAEPIT